MDGGGQLDRVQNYDHQYPVLTQTPAPQRKRSRPSESPSDPNKAQDRRDKARERQRRKRERDRQRESMGSMGHGLTPDGQNGTPFESSPQDLSPDEMARRDRVRMGARERQRKHRALIKQRKMAELGMTMGTDGLESQEDLHYTLVPNGMYQAVMQRSTEMGTETPFPQGHTGGQTFASTLLLSFSCSPLLKQHLLRTLRMTNEELASLEPVLSAAWDQWDHAVSGQTRS